MFKVLVIAEGIIPSTELMVLKPFDYLSNNSLIRYEFVTIKQLIDVDFKYNFNYFNCFFLLRLCSEQASGPLLDRLVSLNKKIIYALDDDFSSIDPDTAIGKIYTKMEPQKHINILCRNANVVLVTSKSLNDKLSSVNPFILTIPALVDFLYLDTLDIKTIVNDKVVIGYAATQHTHSKDFEIVAAALSSLTKKYKDKIQIELFFDEVPEALKDCDNVICLPPVEGLNNYYKTLASRNWDIGIAPFVNNEFNNAKSDNKFREYAAFKIAGIYSNISVFRDVIINNVTGLLANNTYEDWYNNLDKLINNSSVRQLIAQNAYGFVKSKYNIQIITNIYIKIFRYIIQSYDPIQASVGYFNNFMNNTVPKKVSAKKPKPVIENHVYVGGLMRVLAIAEGPMPSTELFIHKPLQVLSKSNDIVWDYIPINHLLLNIDIIKKYDIIFILRVVGNFLISHILPIIQKFNKKIIYALDDDFTKLDNTTGIGIQYLKLNCTHNIYNFKKHAHHMVVYSKGLYDTYKDSTEHLSLLYGPITDVHNYPVDDSIKEKIRIGYAGNDHHLHNFNVVKNVIIKLLTDYGDRVQFECFFNHVPAEFKRFPGFISHGKVNGIDKFYEFLFSRRWDIGIAALIDNPFNNAKSDVKYREYSMLGIAGIYSNITAYSQSVINQENGILVNNNEVEWYNSIVGLIENEELRRKIVINSNEEVRNRCSIDKISSAYLKIFKEVLK